MTRTPYEMRADAEVAVKTTASDWKDYGPTIAMLAAICASDVLSLLAERDTAYAHGKRAGLISAAEYLEHEATLTEANRDRATDKEHRRAYTVQAGIYRSGALVCRSRAAVATPEAERSSPDDLRAAGWAVAVHNDYRQGNQPHTFWFFTRDGCAVKGEGRTDADALDEVRRQIHTMKGGGA